MPDQAMKTLITPAIITGFSSKVDKSLGFRGVTPELSVSERVAFMEYQGINCRMLLEPTDFTADGRTEVKGVLDQKSPSVRLRGALYVLWNQLMKAQKIDQPFMEFYLVQMDRLIDDIKSQLEPE
jgi:hypothetical protein